MKALMGLKIAQGIYANIESLMKLVNHTMKVLADLRIASVVHGFFSPFS